MENNGRSRCVQLSARIADIPRKLTFVDGSVFETADNEGVDAVLVQTGFARPSRIHLYERFHPRLIMVVAAAALLLFGAISYGLPAGAYIAVKLTPDPIIALIDDGVVITIDRTVLGVSQLPEPRQNELTEKFRDMIQRSGALDEPPNLLFRRGGVIGANAFALPGGTVIVTDELVALADKDDQILGVLAHELGHVIHFHSLQQIYRALGLSFLIAAAVGDPGPIIEDVVAHGALLLSLSYSRQFELDADAEGVRIMEAAGLGSACPGRHAAKARRGLQRLRGIELVFDPSGDWRAIEGNAEIKTAGERYPACLTDNRYPSARQAGGLYCRR